MASLAVVIIILGCAALQYFKGTFVKAFAMIIIAICASVVAFGYFEVLANFIIRRGNDGSMLSLVPWAQTLCFILLFIVTFGILQTAAVFLIRHPVDLGFLPERIGRVVCGIILGFIISGLLLTALQMGPLPLSYPYQRFDPARLNPDNPGGVLLNADGFATGLFGLISNGSLSGKNSFKTLHPSYLDQLFLNRFLGDVSGVSGVYPAIEVPKPGVWPASQTVKEQVDKFVTELRTRGGKVQYEPGGKSVAIPISTKEAYNPTIVRVGIKKRAINREAKINGGVFTPSQLRLICTRKTGEAVNAYPIGYLKSKDEIQISPEIKLATSDIEGNVRFIDFVFCVPSGFDPALVGFKLNSIVEIPTGAIVSADQAPEVVPFSYSPSAPQSNTNAQRPARTQTPQQQQQARPRRSGLSDTSRSVVGDELDE
ncbi:MAG: CvpA family protein [Sedimentisphaerales bacterium]